MGLSEKLRQAAISYESDGYAIIREVVPTALVEEISQHVDWLIARYPELRPEHLHHPLIRNDAFWVRVILEPRLLDIAEQFLGPNLACFTAHYVCKPPRDGHAVFWHQDGAYWNLDPLEALTVWLAVDESKAKNGCLEVIPGSHHLPLQKLHKRDDAPNLLFSSSDEILVDELVERHGSIRLELNPGDVSIHHPNLLHQSEPNTSEKRRCGLDIGYISTKTRIQADGVYLNPLLVRGNRVFGVNEYRAVPEYRPDETIEFRGHERWNEKAKVLNEASGLAGVNGADRSSPLDAARHMVDRLIEGTVAH